MINLEDIKKKYKAKEVSLAELHKYFPEIYSPNVSLFEVGEGYIDENDYDDIKMLLTDAIYANALLDEEDRRYNLFILCFANGKLAYTFSIGFTDEYPQLMFYLESLEGEDFIY